MHMNTQKTLDGNLYKNTAGYYDYDNREIVKDDLDFYVSFAEKTNGPILELASGTGRVSLYIAEKVRRIVECIELSAEMRERFLQKLSTSHKHLREFINLRCGDMSDFDLGQKFELVIIPWRALQWLPVQEKTEDCLRCVHKHLADNGVFVFDIFKPRTYDSAWLGNEDVSYDIVDSGRRVIRSTVNHYADTEKKYIQYKNKIKILENGVETVTEDLLTIKYYDYEDIMRMLKRLGFRVLQQYGYYDFRDIKDGDEMIFVCTKQ